MVTASFKRAWKHLSSRTRRSLRSAMKKAFHRKVRRNPEREYRLTSWEVI